MAESDLPSSQRREHCFSLAKAMQLQHDDLESPERQAAGAAAVRTMASIAQTSHSELVVEVITPSQTLVNFAGQDLRRQHST